MNDKEMIEKMANIPTKEEIEARNKIGKGKDELRQALLHYATAEATNGIKTLIDCEGCAFYLYEILGYQKVDKDSVVLTREEYENLCFNMQETEKASFNINQMNGNLIIENQQLKDRIALLEKDNELLRNAKVVYENVDYCYEDFKKAEKRIAELEKGNEALSFAVKQGFNDCQANTLKQFAERLKEKIYSLWSGRQLGELLCDIDETLKEFIGK